MSLEFAIVAPVFLMLLVAIFGVGLSGFYQLILDDAVRNAARQVQIGGPASGSGTAFASAVCNEFAKVAVNCLAGLSYNVQANTAPALFAAMKPVAVPANGDLPDAFPALTGNSNVIIQVAYRLPLVVPYVGQAMTFTGTNSILATTAIRMEPHS